MPTRVLNTKFVIQGESEYKSAIANINSTLKVLKSELTEAESRFRTNANSLEALSKKEEVLNKLKDEQTQKINKASEALANSQKYLKEYTDKVDELKQKLTENTEKLSGMSDETKTAGEKWASYAETVSKSETELERLKNTSGDTSEQQTKLQEKIDKAKAAMERLETSTGGAAKEAGELILENKNLNKELQDNETKAAAAQKSVNNWTISLNTAQTAENNLKQEIAENKKYLDEAKDSTDECAKSIDEYGNSVKEQKNALEGLATVLASGAIKKGLEVISSALQACVDASMDFETAMASVKRTVGGTDEFIDELADSFQELSLTMPITTTELATIAATAGQLGVAQENVEEFTVIMAELATTTDLTAETAATMLAQFANITGVEDYERLGSTVADLGDATATTATKIVEMSQGIAAAASVAGMSATDVLGISAAVGSLGIESQAGSTAMSTLIQTLYKAVETGDGLENFASVAGMSASEFRTAWGVNAVDAMTAFIQGLNDTERNGKSAIVILDELGITNQRQVKAITGLATSGDLLSNAIAQANNAWTSNTALAEKASIMYETTEAKVTMLDNAVTGLKVSVGDQLTPALGELAGVGGDVIQWAADFIDQHEAIVPVITAVIASISAFTVAATTIAVATSAVGEAMKAAAAAAAANPYILAATAIVTLGTAIFTLAANADDAVPTVKSLTTAAQDMESAIGDTSATIDDTVTSTEAAAAIAERYIEKLEELEAAGLDTEENQKEYHNTLVLLSELVPEVAGCIDLETDAIYGGTEALRANTEQWKKNAVAQAYQEKLTELAEKNCDVLLEQQENEIKHTKAVQEAEAAQKELNDTYERMDELMRQAQEQADAWYEETGQLTEASQWLSQEYYDLNDSIFDLNEQIDVAEQTAQNYEQAMQDDAEAVAAAQEEMDLATEAIEALTGATEDNTEATEDNSEAQAANASAITGIKEQMSTLAQSYKDSYDAAYSSISGQIGLFDDFEKAISDDTDTVEEMMALWAEQTANLDEYTRNLKLAADYGIDEGLVASLSDGSTESAGYLATIISKIEELGGSTEGMSDEASSFVDEFNASFARTEEAKESFANTVASIETDLDNAVADLQERAASVDFSGFNTALESAFAGVGVDFQNVGISAGSGLASGIQQSTSNVETAASAVGDAAESATKDSINDNGTSKDFQDIGKDIDEGLAEGIDGNANEVTDSAEDMTDALKKASQEGAKDAVDAFSEEFGKIVSKADEKIAALKKTVSSGMSTLPNNMYTIGQQMVNGMINGMNNRSSTLYYTISDIVNTAITRAKTAAATASPSKKTTKIFEDVGEGMIVGLEHKRERVAQKAQNVVDQALKLDVSGKVEAAMLGVDERMPSVKNIMYEKTDAAAKATSEEELTVLRSVDEKLEKLLTSDRAVVLDDDTIVGRWSSKIDKALERNYTRKERGSA